DVFVGSYYAVRFVHNKPRKEWKMCNKCRNKEKCVYQFRKLEYFDSVANSMASLHLSKLKN
ncbi:MAG: hypothetical protein ACKPKO_09635, partial [Candidatus Fonsibacter sp.]